MLVIQQVSDDPKQRQNLVLPDGSTIQLSIEWKPMQFGWFITELSYGDFVLRGLRICVSPNMLHQFRNQIPFGLACFSTNNREPSQQQDFSSGAATLYILTSDEVSEFTEVLSNG